MAIVFVSVAMLTGADSGAFTALCSARMPSPPKTTDADIVAAARKLVERHGRTGLSMGDVAAAVGVRAPSLYGRFAD